MDHRQVKDRLYANWAEIGKAFASPKRVELLDLLAQGERTVEALAREADLTVNNTSSHLSILKRAHLVDTRREAQFIYYRLADDAVVGLLHEVQALARRRLHEVEHLARTYLEGRDTLEPIGAAELARRLRAGDVTVIDVRPELEYAAGHISSARSVPLDVLERRLAEFPRTRPVVAYCRGAYCVYAVEAVERLRGHGFHALRLEDGLPDWRRGGYPVAVGPEPGPLPPSMRAGRRPTRRR